MHICHVLYRYGMMETGAHKLRQRRMFGSAYIYRWVSGYITYARFEHSANMNYPKRVLEFKCWYLVISIGIQNFGTLEKHSWLWPTYLLSMHSATGNSNPYVWHFWEWVLLSMAKRMDQIPFSRLLTSDIWGEHLRVPEGAEFPGVKWIFADVL